MEKICQRRINNCKARKEDSRLASHLLERECPNCGARDVIYICWPCTEYINMKLEASRQEKSWTWRCLECEHMRYLPEGLHILGTV